ncbi:response regulator [Inhella gelatinilytica]|uniref:Response regulator transcription factor n=1 Tax=Inhella gelatinilytica TaxID=2795030 RepID=A0A931NBF7_9BURK|nr:response regulator transcription factor [Inhella gelatinilytica]MBH9553533.1 response regulator transcription factor [Inhella gelatinilytica]
MRLLLVDDHPLILLAVRTLLADFKPAVDVVAAGTAAAAREILAGSPPVELLLLNLQLPGEDGFSLLDEWREAHPAVPIAVMSGSDSMADVIRAIDQGAMAYLPKTSHPELMKEALELVVSGGIYVPPMRMTGVPPPQPGEKWVPPDPPPPPALPVGAVRPSAPALTSLPITPRQHEVLKGLLMGKPNKLIASELKISADTVKDHVQAIFRALGVRTRTQAVLAVSQLAER